MQKRPPLPGWQNIGAGYESSTSRELIEQTVGRLIEKRLPVFLASPGYQSGLTLLLETGENELLIDKPRNWRPCPRVRVIFKDETKISHHFDVRILATADTTLHAAPPDEIFRLQRRASYRVAAPQGCKVSFRSNGTHFSGFTVKNISAGGMLFCGKNPVDLARSSLLDIALFIPAKDDTALAGGLEKTIRRGEVVRSFRDKQHGLNCYGVSFLTGPREEDDLARYIRQRERELLSKGVAD
ncbi:flagellar brake protein [Thiovibrio sp. JS02]